MSHQGPDRIPLTIEDLGRRLGIEAEILVLLLRLQQYDRSQ
jgi:hypothetical protein